MRIITVLLALSMVAGSAPAVFADDKDQQDKFDAKLSGYNEVIFATTTTCAPGGTAPPCTLPAVSVINSAALRGAVSTTGKGKFELKINDGANTISYKLSYKDLEGDITQAHIHFGQRFTPGGIVLFLCANPPVVPPAGTPLCPGTTEGEVDGVLEPADVVAQVPQGIAGPADFAEILRAIRNDATYANVHSSLHPQGEIRGHIEPDRHLFFHRH